MRAKMLSLSYAISTLQVDGDHAVVRPAPARGVVPGPVRIRHQTRREPLAQYEVVDGHALAVAVLAADRAVVGARVDEVRARGLAVIDLGPHRGDRARRVARRLALAVESAVEVADDAEGLAGARPPVDPVLEHRHLALQQTAVVAVRGQRVAVAGGFQVHGEQAHFARRAGLEGDVGAPAYVVFRQAQRLEVAVAPEADPAADREADVLHGAPLRE